LSAPSRRLYLKYGAGLSACLVLAYYPFARGTRVPLLGGVDLGFHELGHMLTYWLPDVVTAMMGSIVQVAVPIGLAAYFWWRHEFLGTGLCLAWGGASAWDASVYIADAPYQLLPLIGGEHDWAFVLGHWNALEHAAGIASLVKGSGAALAIAGVAVCAAGPWLESRRQELEAAEEQVPAPSSPSSEGWAIIPPWERSGEGGPP
jgi:hypothetical protein